LHFRKFLLNNERITSGFFRFFFPLKQILSRMVMVRVYELVEEFSGLFAYGVVGVCGNIRREREISSVVVWARETTVPNRSRSTAETLVGRVRHLLTTVSVELVAVERESREEETGASE
jgi:hypothetical protein